MVNNTERFIDTTPILNRNIGLNYNKSMSPEKKVDYLVQNLRLIIDNHKQLHELTGAKTLDYNRYPFRKNEYSIKQDSLLGEGKATVDLLRRLHWEKDGISFEKYDLKNLKDFYSEEQSDFKDKLSQNAHSISIVTIDEKRYIVDCSYRQFFPSQDKHQNIEQIDLSEICLKDEKKKKVAEQILKYGWIEATPENIKAYMDMFLEASTGNKNIDFPTEKEYTEKIKGKIITGDVPARKVTEGCVINNGIKQYYIDKKCKEEDKNKIGNYRKIINAVNLGKYKFSIIQKNEKYFLKGDLDDTWCDSKIDKQLKETKNLILEKAKRGAIEYTPKNLFLYIKAFLILVSGDPNIETPSIEEYNEILGIDNLRKYGVSSDTYIIDSEPDIINNYEYNQFDEEMSVEDKLTSIVQKERKFLMKSRNLMAESLIGDCEDSTARISFDCVSKGFVYTHYLFPGYYLENVKGHNATITSLDGKNYLIDCTYRQFFTASGKDDNPRYIYER